MRLFEAIIDANHRAVAGDKSAGLHPGDFADELPIIALTCIDPRLNALFPNVLGIPPDQFIWLRNAGNIITGPITSTMRSLALACAVKEGREIAVIGHTDCHVCSTTTLALLDKLQRLGVERSRLPENLNEFFGMFATEAQNVIKACDYVRHSPLIGPKIPVHGLLVDINTGMLDWIVNGYQNWPTMPAQKEAPLNQSAHQAIGALGSLADFDLGEMKTPGQKIGELGGGDIGRPQPAPEAPMPSEAAPAAVPPPPPSEWLRAGSAQPPASPGKKQLPPPIRPKIVRR